MEELLGGIAWSKCGGICLKEVVWGNYLAVFVAGICTGNAWGNYVGNCLVELLGDMFGRIGRGHGWGMVWEN